MPFSGTREQGPEDHGDKVHVTLGLRQVWGQHLARIAALHIVLWGVWGRDQVDERIIFQRGPCACGTRSPHMVCLCCAGMMSWASCKRMKGRSATQVAHHTYKRPVTHNGLFFFIGVLAAVIS